MATKYVCDKCGNDRGSRLYRIRIVPKVGASHDDDDAFTESKLDLCEGCMERIKNEANTPNPKLAD